MVPLSRLLHNSRAMPEAAALLHVDHHTIVSTGLMTLSQTQRILLALLVCRRLRCTRVQLCSFADAAMKEHVLLHAAGF